MKIKVGVSNRHVHLSREILAKLFGENYSLKVRRQLMQTGEYASETKVNLKTDSGIIEGVRVIGPLREYTQVEILRSDADILGINPPVRNSGDLNNSESLTIVGVVGMVTLDNVCIIANRHIHMNERDAEHYNVKNGEIVSIKKDNIIIDNVHVKINPTYILECHLDKDDENRFDIHTGEYVEIIK